MSIQTIQAKEQLVKRVVKSGNGGCVWVPLAWLGREVIVVMPKYSTEDLKYEILKLLGSYLDRVQGIFLYGSFARNEQEDDSDVDVLAVIDDAKIQLNKMVSKDKITINGHKLDLKIITKDKLKTALEHNPIMYLSILNEAKPILNAALLEELRKRSIDDKKAISHKFAWFLKDTEEHIKSNKEFIELDKLDGNYLESYAAAYSLILRLRGIYLIECIRKNKKYCNKEFAEFAVSKSNISIKEFDDIYAAYKLIRDDKKIINLKIKIERVEKLLNLLNEEVNRLKKC